MAGLQSIRLLALLFALAVVSVAAPLTAEEAQAANEVTKQLIPIRLMDLNHNGKLEESDMADYGRKLVALYIDEATRDIRQQRSTNPDFKAVFTFPLLKNIRRMAEIDRMRAKLINDIASELGNLDTNRDGVLDNQEFRKMAYYVTGAKALFRDLDGEDSKGYVTEDDLLKAEALQSVGDVLKAGMKAYANNAKPLFLRDKKAEVSMTTEDVSLVQRYFRDAQTIYVKRSSGLDFLVSVIESELKIQLQAINEKLDREH